MKHTSVRPLLRTVGALLLGVAVAGAPALSYAQHSSSGGGGHSGGGGGGHFSGGGGGHSGGGGHFAGGGGGHFSGGGHFAGGGNFGGAPRFAGGQGGHYASHGGYIGASAGAHFAGGTGAAHGIAPHYGGAGFAAGRFAGGHVFYPGRGGFYPGRFWGGGYWHGGYWPHCYFYPGFAWFLPILPFGYATFWWSGVPYYYVNDLYYTYSPSDNGYVVTEPPPAAGDEASAQGGSAQPDNGAAYAAPGSANGDVYIYPRNGQTDQQMSNDRYECHSWASGQTGFDPTRGGGQAGTADSYRRAMVACLDARGYSAR